jgi:transposase
MLTALMPAPRSTATSIGFEFVRKFADQAGFAVHPRQWVVEQTFAWVNRNRRLANFEQTIRSATAFLHAAAAMMLTRRLARYTWDLRLGS